MKNKNHIALTVLVIILIIFATFVWPTRYMYMYDHIQGNVIPVRINRFTDEAEWLMVGLGWQDMKTKPTPEYIDPFAKKGD